MTRSDPTWTFAGSRNSEGALRNLIGGVNWSAGNYSADMNILGFDHIVLCVRDVEVSLDFYERILGMTRRAERQGKWSLHFGRNKISLQDAIEVPAIAKRTVPGSGNFCLLCDMPIASVVVHLRSNGIEIVEGPAEKAGATGRSLSVYFRDPDLNLIEISNVL